MNNKTKSALRSALAQESEALEARLPDPAPESPAPAVEVAVAATLEVPAESGAPAVPAVAEAASAEAVPVVDEKPKAAPVKAAKAAPKAAAPETATPKIAKAPAKAVTTTEAVEKKAKAVKPEKSAKAPKVEKPAKAAKVAKPVKPVREKVVRDSFSMPKSEHAQLKALRETLAKAGRICSKSELLRAGVQLLLKESTASSRALIEALVVVPKGKSAK